MTLHNDFEEMGPAAVKTALAAGILTLRASKEARTWLSIRQSLEAAIRRSSTARAPGTHNSTSLFQPLATLCAAFIALFKGSS